MIPCSNPKMQYLAHREEINSAIARVLDSGWYILGEEVKAFEAAFSGYIGVRHAVGVGNGTDALYMALTALDIGPGDEVITVSHTAVATVSAILLAGATPVFVDIDPETFTMDPTHIRKKITAQTRAIIPVHIYGHPAEMHEIVSIAQEDGIKVIEDCAQAHGAALDNKKVGSMGHMACFSFYPTKNMGAIGDGGAVVTDDGNLAQKLKLLREYGWKERFISSIPGWNSRLDEIQAAILRVKLKYLDQDHVARTKLAARYEQDLAHTDLKLPVVRDNVLHAYHLYVVRANRRDELRAFLRSKRITTAIHYPVPVHLQPAFTHLETSHLPHTEKAAHEILSLPLYPGLTGLEMETIVNAIKEFFI